MDTTPAPIVVDTDWRQRSVKGLGAPNLPRLYTPEERADRRYLINALRHMSESTSGDSGEPQMPLWYFLGKHAHARIDAKRPSLEGRRFWEHFPSGSFPLDDPTLASIPGLQARHVYEARLSRLAFLHTLEDIAAEVISDFERSDGAWDDMEFLPAIYPYSARAWEPETIVEHTLDSVMRLCAHATVGDMDFFTCVADRMLFQFAAEMHTAYLDSLHMDVPVFALDEALLDNSDFLLLFDPAWDGIENDEAAGHADLDIAGPLSWFGEDVLQQTIAEMSL